MRTPGGRPIRMGMGAGAGARGRAGSRSGKRGGRQASKEDGWRKWHHKELTPRELETKRLYNRLRHKRAHQRKAATKAQQTTQGAGTPPAAPVSSAPRSASRSPSRSKTNPRQNSKPQRKPTPKSSTTSNTASASASKPPKKNSSKAKPEPAIPSDPSASTPASESTSTSAPTPTQKGGSSKSRKSATKEKVAAVIPEVEVEHPDEQEEEQVEEQLEERFGEKCTASHSLNFDATRTGGSAKSGGSTYVWGLVAPIDISTPTVAGIGSNRVVKVFNVETGAVLHELPGATQRINQIVFSHIQPDLLYSASDDSTLRLYDLRCSDGPSECPQLCHKISVKGKAELWTVAENLDGSQFAAGGSNNQVNLWDSRKLGEDMNPLVLPYHTESISHLEFVAQDKLVSGSWDGNIYVTDTSITDQKNDDALIAGFNVESQVETFGTYGSNIWCITAIQDLYLSSIEPDSSFLLHKDLLNRLSTPTVSVYGHVGCYNDPSTNNLYLLSTTRRGSLVISLMNETGAQPVSVLCQSHKSTISSAVVSGGKIITSADEPTIYVWSMPQSLQGVQTRSPKKRRVNFQKKQATE
ncbi:hypothetical protein Pelo_5780 [Pelomyxa schiedti]|nr:hypothetical protein Pelo_5780 [Pelomyxa schiedti]